MGNGYFDFLFLTAIKCALGIDYFKSFHIFNMGKNYTAFLGIIFTIEFQH